MPSLGDLIAPRRLGVDFRWLLASSWTSNLGDGIAIAAHAVGAGDEADLDSLGEPRGGRHGARVVAGEGGAEPARVPVQAVGLGVVAVADDDGDVLPCGEHRRGGDGQLAAVAAPADANEPVVSAELPAGAASNACASRSRCSA